MKPLLCLLATLAVAAPVSAQSARNITRSAPPQPQFGAAQLEAHTMELAVARERYAVFHVQRAEGPLFLALASFGTFDPDSAFVVGVGKVDAKGNGTLFQRVTNGVLPPGLELEVAVAYLSGGQTVYSPPTTLRATPPAISELLDFDFAPGNPDPQKGQIIDDEYALVGLNISAVNNVGGKLGEAIVWDGKSPSGGDFDLITPDRDQVLIVAENLVDADMDGFVDKPDDEMQGGTLVLDFDDPVEVTSLTVIDIDFLEIAFARFTREDSSTSVRMFAPLGDGVMQTLVFSEPDVVKLEVVFSGSGGLVDVGLVPCPYLVNFDERTFGKPLDLKTGEWITDQFQDIGLNISVLNNNPAHPDKGILFDSENPTGEDGDLVTPGYGFNNTIPLGKVLIIAEDDVDADMDGYVDDPDDEAAGGQMIFTFDEDVLLYGFTILDVDGSEFDFFEAFDSGDVLIGTQQIPVMGDNSVTQFVVDPPLAGVRKVVLNLDGSGAVTRLRFCPESNLDPR